MTLLGSSTPKCHTGVSSRHLTLDQACLRVTNADLNNTLELWAQAVECYKCLPWKFLSLAPNTTQGLAVNTTYPTHLYVRSSSGHDLEELIYHFGEYGEYHMGINNSNITPVKVYRQPHNETLPLIIAAVFFVMLVGMWQCGKFLLRRMEAIPPRPVSPSVATSERSPLLVPQGNSPDAPSTSSSASTSETTEAASATAQVLPQPQAVVPDSRRSGGRLLSLDTFRGLAIVIMIFVNYGGGKYYFFKHSRWNGLTVADLVFPWFMWIMGVSLTFSIRSQLRRTTKRHLMVWKILERSIKLFMLGCIINSDNGHNYMPTFRIMGVLQRFSICYFINAVMEVYLMEPQESPEYVWYWAVRDLVRSSGQWIITISMIIVHTCLTFLLTVPGCPKGYLGPGGLHDGGAHANCTGGAAGYVDRVVFGEAHILPHPTCVDIYNNSLPYDPEGLLGCLTSSLMVQLGVAAGRIILTYQGHASRIKRWLIWGTVCGLLGGILCGWHKEDGWIPVNKNLWSLSFVLTLSCFAFYLLTICYLLIDKWHWWSGNPLRYAGMNAIFLYVGHEIFGGLFPWSWKPVGNYHANYLIMNLWGTSIWVVIAYLLHRRKLYFSV